MSADLTKLMHDQASRTELLEEAILEQRRTMEHLQHRLAAAEEAIQKQQVRLDFWQEGESESNENLHAAASFG